jgi:hypothetical protein
MVRCTYVYWTLPELELNSCRWKLHLRPLHLSVANVSSIPPLPRGVAADTIFADFLGYVKKQIQAYLTNSHGNGATIWNVLYPTMKVVLTVPNGWEGSQQQRMRSAAVKAGLVDSQGSQRIRFVSEAEAAILFAIDSGCIGDWLTVQLTTLAFVGGELMQS